MPMAIAEATCKRARFIRYAIHFASQHHASDHHARSFLIFLHCSHRGMVRPPPTSNPDFYRVPNLATKTPDRAQRTWGMAISVHA